MSVERIPNETKMHVFRDRLASGKLEGDEGSRKRVETFWPLLIGDELGLVSPCLRIRGRPGRPAIDPVSKCLEEAKEDDRKE